MIRSSILTAPETAGIQTYFLFVRPFVGPDSGSGLDFGGLENMIRARFDASLEPSMSLARFEHSLRRRYGAIDRVEMTVE